MSCQPGSLQVVAGLDAQCGGHTLAEEAVAVCMEEAHVLSQGKHCSLHAVCVNLEHGHPLEVSYWA